MRILHISDIHYRFKFTNKNTYESILSNMDSCLSKLARLPLSDIDCICLTGDLCDDGSVDDYKTLKKYLDDLNIPYFICLGNHDDKKAFYKGWFNRDDDCPYLNISNLNGLNFISFDNSEYGYPDGYIDKYRIDWLSKHIKDNSIVLMHHQLNDLPGIPGLKDRELLLDVLNDDRIIGVLNGHSHWFNEDGNIFTAPSISFRAFNSARGVEFYDCFGYCIYEINNNFISLIDEKDTQGKLLGIWNPKDGNLY